MAASTETSILLVWGEVHCSLRNGPITSYLIKYGRGLALDNEVRVDAAQLQANLTGLSSSTEYAVSIAAVNEDEIAGPAYNLTIFTATGYHSIYA